MKELKCVVGHEEWVGELEEDGVEGGEEEREKETVSLLFAPLTVLQVFCVSTHNILYSNKKTKLCDERSKIIQHIPCREWAVCNLYSLITRFW